MGINMNSSEKTCRNSGNISSSDFTFQGDFRHDARVLSLQFIHQLEVQKGANLGLMDFFLKEHTPDEKTRELARKWIRGIWQNLDSVDQKIRQVSRNWDFSRISPVDRSNLRLAVYQLLYCLDVPHKVVINEAVELAKKFSTAQAPGFVNGVLDTIRKNVEKATTI